MCSFLNDDEEVIMFEPVFEFYFRQADIFEGRTKFLSLQPPKKGSNDWTYDFDLIEKSITPKTKLIVINTPQNPTGKVLTQEEIKNFAQITEKWPQLIVVSDEVTQN